tara:strand:- start:1167 stop:1346 length:180 start_codon:yes stop_codon:yes gene_type:complete
MVKKIRVIEDSSVVPDEMSDAAFRTQVMELAKAVDWKLWELLQTIQRLEKRLDISDNDD